jgi:hypothetical protein
MTTKISTVSWLFLTWLIWGPIIINSQPGSTFMLFGIDWKADNLDNTMFWWGILLVILGGISEGYKERKDDKKIETRDLR